MLFCWAQFQVLKVGKVKFMVRSSAAIILTSAILSFAAFTATPADAFVRTLKAPIPLGNPPPQTIGFLPIPGGSDVSALVPSWGYFDFNLPGASTTLTCSLVKQSWSGGLSTDSANGTWTGQVGGKECAVPANLVKNNVSQYDYWYVYFVVSTGSGITPTGAALAAN